MKPTVILLVVLSVSAAAYDYRYAYSAPTPGPNPRGCWGGGGGGPTYVVQDGPVPYVYKISAEPPTGSIYSSFPCPGGPGAWGIGEHWNYFYITNYDTSWIYKTTTTGSLVSSFLSGVPHPAGLCYRYSGSQQYLHVAFPDENYIGLLDTTTGSLVSTLPGPGTEPTACGPNSGPWFVADAGTGTVYEYGVPVATGIGAPVGFYSCELTRGPWTWEFFVVDDATDSILVYRKVTVNVGPASLGRVKALYR